MYNQNKKRKILFVIGPLVLLVTLIGITFAFFNYTRIGAANTIRVGRISFVSNNEETISLNNLFPIDPTETGIMNDSTKVGTYSIDITGDTDYSGGIEYLVSTTNTNIYTSTGKTIPISLAFTVDDLGTENSNYFSARENTNESIYKKLVGNTLVGDQMLLVGFIVPNTTSGQAQGIDGSITIKAYLDENNILISDTYDGTESDNMGTPNSMAEGKTVFTTGEWNSLQANEISFKVKVEANEGIWVAGSLEEIMKKSAVMDNTTSTYVSAQNGIDFGAVSSDNNGKGVYIRSGTENNPYPIMYYRGDVNDNNVVFANKCWKMVRTTETGGVKLIYNGLPSAVYQQAPLAESDYTMNSSVSDSRWTFDSSDNSWNIEVNDNSHPAMEFNVPAGDNYRMVMTGTSGSTCGGQFAFYKNETPVDSATNGSGAAMNLSYDYGTITSSDRIQMNYTGSSSSSCVITFKLQMFGDGDLISNNGCDNTGTNTHITIDVNNTPTNTFTFNNSNNSPAYVGYMYGTVYAISSSSWTSGARFGSSFTWDGTNYTLVGDSVTTPDATHHYSCNVTTEHGTCTNLRYVFYVSENTKNYITLTGGDGIEEALVKMKTNTNESNAKDKIDTWYENNLITYTNKLEDTIWCNDRSIGKYNGWSPTGAFDTSGYRQYSLLFGTFERSSDATSNSPTKNQPSLACTNKNDRFTVNNTNGNMTLDYPIALLTEDEMTLAGGIVDSVSTFYLDSGTNYWSMSPYYFNTARASDFYLLSDKIEGYYVTETYGLRPSISIKPGIPIVSGTGTVNDPYVIN